MKIAKTVDEVLDKYEVAIKMDPPWERVTIFSWEDMLKLKNEILALRKANSLQPELLNNEQNTIHS